MTHDDAWHLAIVLIARLKRESQQAMQIAQILKFRPKDVIMLMPHIQQIQRARNQEVAAAVLRLTDLHAQAERLLIRKVSDPRQFHHLVCYLVQLGDWAYGQYGVTRLMDIREAHALAFLQECRKKGQSPRVVGAYQKAIRLGLGLLRER